MKKNKEIVFPKVCRKFVFRKLPANFREIMLISVQQERKQ